MGLITASAMPMPAFCAGPGGLPVDGMTAMYGLMSLFHLAPWLKIAAERPRART
jgi:hypothetical protein